MKIISGLLLAALMVAAAGVRAEDGLRSVAALSADERRMAAGRP